MRRLVPVVLGVVVLAGCPQLTPDDHPFPCRDDGDCGAGWTCGPGPGARFCLKSQGIPDAGSAPDGGSPADECGLTAAGLSAPRVDGETWTVQLGGAMSEQPDAIARAADGSLYVAGTVGNPDGVYVDGMLVKLTAGGAFEWCRRLASATPNSRHQWTAVVVDAHGSIFVAGNTDSAIEAGTPERGVDVVVARYEPDGSRRWLAQDDFSLSIDTPSDDKAASIALDSAGNVRVVGETTGAPPGEPVSPQGSGSALLLSYDVLGHRLAAKTLADSLTWATGRAVASGPGEALFAVVFSSESMLASPSDPTSFGWMTIVDLASAALPRAVHELVVTTDPDKVVGTGGPSALTVVDGDAVVVGQVGDRLAGTTSVGGGDAFAVRFGATSVRWARRFGSVNSDDAVAVVTCGASLCVAGNSYKPVAPGSQTIQVDPFVARLRPSDGVVEQLTGFGSPLDDLATGLVSDGAGGVVVVGSTDGDLGRRSGGSRDLFVRRMVP